MADNVEKLLAKFLADNRKADESFAEKLAAIDSEMAKLNQSMADLIASRNTKSDAALQAFDSAMQDAREADAAEENADKEKSNNGNNGQGATKRTLSV